MSASEQLQPANDLDQRFDLARFDIGGSDDEYRPDVEEQMWDAVPDNGLGLFTR